MNESKVLIIRFILFISSLFLKNNVLHFCCLNSAHFSRDQSYVSKIEVSVVYLLQHA